MSAMTAEGHIIFALAVIILVKKTAFVTILSQGDWWHIIAGSILSCLLPDLDHPRSFLGQRLLWISHPIFYIFGHRGFTHSLLAIIIGVLFVTLLLPENFIPFDVFHAMIIGYLSHIVVDMLTPAGVPLLWPYRWRCRLPIMWLSRKIKNLERLLSITALMLALIYPYEFFFHYLIVPDIILVLWQRMKFFLF